MGCIKSIFELSPDRSKSKQGQSIVTRNSNIIKAKGESHRYKTNEVTTWDMQLTFTSHQTLDGWGYSKFRGRTFPFIVFGNIKNAGSYGEEIHLIKIYPNVSRSLVGSDKALRIDYIGYFENNQLFLVGNDSAANLQLLI